MGLACCKDSPTTQPPIRKSSLSGQKKNKTPASELTPIQKQPTTASPVATSSTVEVHKFEVTPSTSGHQPTTSAATDQKDVEVKQARSAPVQNETDKHSEPSSPEVKDPFQDETPKQGEVQPIEPKEVESTLPPTSETETKEIELPKIEVEEVSPPTEIEEIEHPEGCTKDDDDADAPKIESVKEPQDLPSDSSSDEETSSIQQLPSSESHEEEIQVSESTQPEERLQDSQPSVEEKCYVDDAPPPLPSCPPPESDDDDTPPSQPPFPEIKSSHSLVAKYVTKDLWEKLSGIKTATSGFTLKKAIACATDFDNQHCGIYAGDWDSYKDFKDIFDPIIQEYHGIASDSKHTSDMEVGKLKGNINSEVPVKSVRIRVGRNIDGFGLSPGITKDQRLGVENLMKSAFQKLTGDLAGNYFPLTGMDEAVRQQLVDDHFLFMSGDPNLQVAGMERDWPEGRGIYHNKEKTFLVWVNEEDQLRIISMQKGGDVKAVFARLANGIQAVGDSVKGESEKEFAFDPKYGFIHSCPTNLGTGMRASVHVDLPGWTKEGLDALKDRCEELKVQPRGTRGESGGQTGVTYDISNKHRLGYSEVELVQCMIDGVNTLYEEDVKLQKKHGL